MIQKAFGECSANKIVAQMLQRQSLLKVIHVLEGLEKAEHLRLLNVYRLQSTKISN